MATIRLLGPPALVADGAVRQPRGRKAWAVLAYLLLAERPPARSRLAELLFGDADDPLGALRWTLAELRRSLGIGLDGDPVTVTVPPGTVVDVRRITGGQADPASLLEVEGELLERVRLDTCLEFESWLVVERHRISALVEARLRQAAAELLAGGRAADATPFAARAVARNPLEEGNHELLIRCMTVAGDRVAAQRQLAVCADLLRRELGIEPSAAVREAAGASPGSAMVLPLGGRAAALSQLEAGRAAIAAGAVEPGLQCLRRAVAEAGRCRDTALRARALAALGGALVHALRGRDGEGVVVLHEAILLATEAGDRATAVTAHRELGFVEVQAGHRATGEAWLARAQALAETDAELAAVLGVRGMNASDRADYPTAFTHLNASVERARSAGDERQEAWSLSLLARAHMLRDEPAQAAVALTRCLDLIQRQRWMAFLPWPQTLQAELDLARGDVDTAAGLLEQAWSMARQLDDVCWLGMAARGMGLLHTVHGDHPSAAEWLSRAADLCVRTPDRYQWVHAHVLDAAITTALAHGDRARAVPMTAALATLSAHCDLRELTVRAHLHRHALGESGALSAARLHAADLDNPALTPLLGSSMSLRTIPPGAHNGSNG